MSEGLTAMCSATGLAPLSDASCTVRSTPVVLWAGKASATGTVSVMVRLPTALEAGTHTLTFDGVASNGTKVTAVATMSMNLAGVVTAAADSAAVGGPTTTVKPGTLPATGGMTSALLALAGFLFVVGCLLVIASIARRSRPVEN